MALELPKGWRGLAHFQLESRRQVLKKSVHARTFNELYILDEIASHVKCLSNLPFLKRLELCKLFHYQEFDANTVVYEVGDFGGTVYIIFTGSVKVTAIGERPNDSIILNPGNLFGESVLLEGDQIRRETVITLDKCELVLLTKQNYDNVLRTEISQDFKEKVETLKGIDVLRGIPDQSIRRLASLLIPRKFAKNRVIAFQGEEAMEMYFMKTGECRVVMEVIKEPKRSSTSMTQLTLRSSRFPSLVMKDQINSQSVPPPMKYSFSSTLPPLLSYHSSIANSTNKCCAMDEAASSYESFSSAFGVPEERKNLKSLSRLSFMSMTSSSELDLRGFIKGTNKSKSQLHSLTFIKKSPYTLKTFLQEFVRRETRELIPDLDYSDIEAPSWKTVSNLSGVHRGDVSDCSIYQERLESWARKVMAREWRVRAEAAIDHDCVPNVPKQLVLNSRQGQSKKVSPEATVLLDVGALHAGDLFGEVGLLHHSQRKASVLTVTAVEVLVLSKWDFNRELDRDIVDRLAANVYKNVDCFLQDYRETCRWALYKKKVMQEVLATRQQRFPNLFEHDMSCRRSGARFSKRD